MLSFENIIKEANNIYAASKETPAIIRSQQLLSALKALVNAINARPKGDTELIEQLVKGIECWASDEDDGVHPDCFEAYKRAKDRLGTIA